MTERNRDRRLLPGYDRRQAMRWNVRLPVELRESRLCWQRVTLIEISRIGCRVETGFRLPERLETSIRLPALTRLSASLVWSTTEEAGLRFDMCLHLAVVQHVLAQSAARARMLSDASGEGASL